MCILYDKRAVFEYLLQIVCFFVFPSEIFLSPLKFNRPLKIKEPGSVCVCVLGWGGVGEKHSTIAALLALINS